ncbi:MAG: hypothetical protein VB047_09565 [Anaerotignum propionicum]|uniref:hypothetical protein n=1 Tax=Anaerotignum propionicum TaxID=28446 RepID=UPI002B2043BF|nr:hypothetical protein [Anaerotignum propionicum]MEA5057788.1 hypothetical protein [Anaerotignum propionicum]
MNEIGTFLLAAFGFIGGAGIVSGIVLRRIDKMNAKLDAQTGARVEESIVIVSGIKAIGHLAEATAIAQRDGHTNGEMKTAMEYYTESKDELNNYLLRRAAERTHVR